jgi:hypothetical protein
MQPSIAIIVVDLVVMVICGAPLLTEVDAPRLSHKRPNRARLK